MERRRTIGASLPKIPSNILEGIRNTNVRRANSEVIVRSSENGRSPKMIFNSKNIRTSFNQGQIKDIPGGRRIVVRRPLSGQNSFSSSRTGVSTPVSEKEEDSFSSISIPEFSTPTVTASTTPVPTVTTPILTASPSPVSTETTPSLTTVTTVTTDTVTLESESGKSSSADEHSDKSHSDSLTSEDTVIHNSTEDNSITTKIHINGYSSSVSEAAQFKIADVPTPPPSPPTSPENDVTSYDLTTVADILHSLSPETPPTSPTIAPPVLNFPPPPSSPPPELSQSELDQENRPPTPPPPPIPQSSLPDLTPPPSPEPPLRTSSRNDNHVLSLPVKRSHSPVSTAQTRENGTESPPFKKTPDLHPFTTRQPAQPPTPPPPPPPPPPIIMEPEADSRPRGGSLSESDISRTEDEILKYFNRTVTGENTISSDSSSQIGDLPGLSLPKEEVLSTSNIDTPQQFKGSNSLSPSDNQKVIKWNEVVKTTRAAIKPGTVDELKLVYLRLGDENFKPSVIKKRRKEGLKLSKAQQLKRYKKVMDMFSADESFEEAPLSPTSTSLRNVEIIERSVNGAVPDSQMEISETAVTNDVQDVNMEENLMKDADRWDSAENDESNPYSRANITAFLNKRLATIQKKNFEEGKKKEDREMYTSKTEDSNELVGEADEPVQESTQFNFTAEQRNSYTGPSRDEAMIDSHSDFKPGEQLDSGSIQRNISPGHVTETGTQRDERAVSSASDIQISFDSKQAEEFSQEQPHGIKDVLQTEESRDKKKDSGFRSLFFEDEPESAPVNDAHAEGGEDFNESSLNTAGLDTKEYTPMFSNGDVNSSTDPTTNMSATVGTVHSFDIQSRSSGVSRSTSGASGLKDKIEESRSGVYVVQDNVGDLYVVEDISDKTRETATVDHKGRIVSKNELDLSHTMDTTHSSIRSFDFNGPDSSKISVDSSDINYGKVKEVMSTLFDKMNTADRGLAVTNFQNDSVERSNVKFSETSVTSDRVMDNMTGHADNHTTVTMRADDTDMALHEDVHKKTILNIVTDDRDRPLWSEQTTDTQVKAWMENGETVDTGADSAYKTSIRLSSSGGHAVDMITPAPDYPGSETDNRHVSTYNVSLADSQTGNSSLSNSLRSGSFRPAPEPEVKDVTEGVTVTTTTSTVIGQKVNMLIDTPQVEEVHMRRNQNDRNINSYRSSPAHSYDRSRITNGYNSDSSLSDDDRRDRTSYKVRQIQSSSLDRNDSSRSGGKTRYITRVESIPKSNRPNIQKTYYTSSDTMTTKVDNTRSSFGEADSQYGSQTSKGTSGEQSPPGGDSPRYRVVRAEMSPTSSLSTPQKHTIYRHVEEKPTRPDFYEYKTFTSEESVNRDGDLWRVNSPVRSTPSNAVVFRAQDSRPERGSPERYRVTKTISAEELFNQGQNKRENFPKVQDSFGGSKEQKVYKSVTNLEFGKRQPSPGRKRRYGARDDSDSDDGKSKYPDTMYRVSNINKDQQFVSKHRHDYEPEPVDDTNDHMYKVVRVTPSDKSKKAERRVATRSLFGSDSREPVYSDDEPDDRPGTNYRIGKTRSTEDLIVTRKVSSRSEKRDSAYKSTVSPTRFDSGYFDDTITTKESHPSHTTVIRLDPGQRRDRPTDSPKTLYKVVNVKSEENLADDKMWSSKKSPKGRRVNMDSSDSEDERRGKYQISSSKYPTTSPEYPSSPEPERRSRKDQTKYYIQRTFSPSRVEDSDPVVLKRIRSTSPQSYQSRVSSPPEWHKSSGDISSRYSVDYDTRQKSTSFTDLTPEKPRNYVHVSDTGGPVHKTDSQSYKAENSYYVRSKSPSPHKTRRNLSRSFSNDLTGDSGTGTEIVSSDNEGNSEFFREQRYKRVEQQIYTMRQEPLCSEIPDEAEDLKVERGKILIRNKIDSHKDDDDFDDNVNVFEHEFHIQKDNPLYKSDQDLYSRFQEEQDEEERNQQDFRNQVTQDITFETVDRIAHKHGGGREVQLSPKPLRKQNLSGLLLSKLANIDSKDIRQNIDVEHHNEEIYGDLDFVHADGSTSASGNTDNFDAVNEKVNLTLKEGKAFVIIKVIAERVVPIDYEFNVWRKSSAIVTRQIEIDLLANEQRRRLYENVMENAGARGAIEGGAYGPHSMTAANFRNDSELSSMDTLKLFSQILSVAEGQGDADETAYTTRQVQGRHSSSGAQDLLY